MKIEINFTPPESCNCCKFAKYKNHQFKHCCLIFDKQIPDYRTGGRLEECKRMQKKKQYGLKIDIIIADDLISDGVSKETTQAVIDFIKNKK